VTEENWLVEIGRNGGFILDGAIGFPDAAKPEDVSAVFQSVHMHAQ
jgi:hypothetical protein